MQKTKNENVVIKLQIDELKEIDANLSNLAERVTEIIGHNDALATAFNHTIEDAQQVLRLIIKTTKRSRFYGKPKLKFGEKPCQQ